jgi:hypothetical protein
MDLCGPAWRDFAGAYESDYQPMLRPPSTVIICPVT